MLHLLASCLAPLTARHRFPPPPGAARFHPLPSKFGCRLTAAVTVLMLCNHLYRLQGVVQQCQRQEGRGHHQPERQPERRVAGRRCRSGCTAAGPQGSGARGDLCQLPGAARPRCAQVRWPAFNWPVRAAVAGVEHMRGDQPAHALCPACSKSDAMAVLMAADSYQATSWSELSRTDTVANSLGGRAGAQRQRGCEPAACLRRPCLARAARAALGLQATPS